MAGSAGFFGFAFGLVVVVGGVVAVVVGTVAGAVVAAAVDVDGAAVVDGAWAVAREPRLPSQAASASAAAS
ncbi:MAG TPA: hypothetical protein VFD04_18520, partial [Actinomycetes bacterium]|nr:hypothetical protein [Actinomycetes bacterium]